jgi:cytochrome c-type biogenesis protein CcmH
VQPDEMLKDAGLEERARNISTGLRCLVCQNQSIDDSNATMARDLRILIREQLVEGKSDSEVVDFVVARYGDFVLLKPRFKGATIVLWLAPFVILGLVLVIAVRKRARPAADPLSEAEKAEIAALIDDKSVPTAKSPQT